jgi:hypothetical protein
MDDMTAGTDGLTILDNLMKEANVHPDVISWIKTGTNLVNFTKSLGSIGMDQTSADIIMMLNDAYQTASSTADATNETPEEVVNEAPAE